MNTIKNIEAIEALDSRGNPTLKVFVTLKNGVSANAIVPSGASTGKNEAIELRDGGEAFGGKGVLKAIKNVNSIIAEEICGKSALEQSKIDEALLRLDGTENYSFLGANATLGVSMAVARAASSSLNLPLYRYIGGVNAALLPVPMFNIINGGAHANNNVDFQEFMIMPFGFSKFSDALKAASEIYQTLKAILSQSGFSTAVGDEGGFAPSLQDNEEPLKFIVQAIKKAGYSAGDQIKLALDVAASEFYDGKNYKLQNREFSSKELIDRYEELCGKYPICSIEDGLSEDDWDGWEALTKRLSSKIQLVGDDLFVTNEKILKNGIKRNIANAILIKPNQIGTITQTMRTVRLAQRNGYKTIMSHRSGESEDSFIADLSVALNCTQIKTGATARSERNAKYNRLLEIEHLGSEFVGDEI